MISASTLKAGSKKSNSTQETILYGKELGAQLQPGDVLALSGTLGAGKTTLIKGIANGYASIPCDEVQSPTFIYHHLYEGKRPIHHFDLYRLADEHAFLRKGFDDYLFEGNLCLIEWSERIAPLLPANTIHINMSSDNTSRIIEVK
jgi:tRNA threonylcarbamoyladenosine biosynthesis protein TsaE